MVGHVTDWKQENLGKRKNNIKSEFDTCICCGKHLENPDDKRIQRINLKKGVSRNNVVIICKEGKEALEKAKQEVEQMILGK